MGQPALVRSVAVNIVDFTAEDVVHDGLELTIRGKNLRGSWDRTLITSGYNTETGELIEQAENLVHTADCLETIKDDVSDLETRKIWSLRIKLGNFGHY